MGHIYEALLRVEELYNSESPTETAKLLKMPKNTYYDNYRKAKEDYEKTKELETSNNPRANEMLETLEKKSKHFANGLYSKIIELCFSDDINLNYIFKGTPPILNKPHTGAADKIKLSSSKTQQKIPLNMTSIPYFEDINNFENNKTKETSSITLPKDIITGKKVKAFKFPDDSMEPNIKKDSIILVDLSKTTLKNTYVYLLKYQNEILIRRLEDLEDIILLRSDNFTYKTINAKKQEVEILGQVLDSISAGATQ